MHSRRFISAHMFKSSRERKREREKERERERERAFSLYEHHKRTRKFVFVSIYSPYVPTHIIPMYSLSVSSRNAIKPNITNSSKSSCSIRRIPFVPFRSRCTAIRLMMYSTTRVISTKHANTATTWYDGVCRKLKALFPVAQLPVILVCRVSCVCAWTRIETGLSGRTVVLSDRERERDVLCGHA